VVEETTLSQPEASADQAEHRLPKTIYVTWRTGPVTSAQIKKDAGSGAGQEVYIAPVSEGGKLQIEMRAKNGRGYGPRTATTTRTADRLHPGDSVHFRCAR